MGPMELGLAATLRSDLGSRAAPIACGSGLVAGALFVATHNPASAGSPFPSCVFHQATGLWCPGCGLTRGAYQLLHGHVGAALSYNIFTPLALAAIVIVWVGMGCGCRLARHRFGCHRDAGRWLAITTAILLLVYGVLRNVPVAPLRALAP